MLRIKPTISNILILYSTIATIGLMLFPALGDQYALFPFNTNFHPSTQDFILSLALFQFLHAGPLHLLMNSVFLFIYGNLIEHLLGKKLTIIFFVWTSIIVALTILFFSTAPTIGISWFALALLAFLFMGLRSTNHPEARWAWLFLLINILVWLTGNISFAGHFGGAIAGILFYIFVRWLRRITKPR